jgi:hypothetical protein
MSLRPTRAREMSIGSEGTEAIWYLYFTLQQLRAPLCPKQMQALGQGGTPEEPVNGTSSDTGTEEPQYLVAAELPEVQII